MKSVGICTKIRGVTSSKITLAAMAICAAGLARAATWQGGASGTLDDAANWDGDITTSAMVFTNDVTLTLSADATVFDVFWNNTTLSNNLQKSRNVTFNLNGKTLANLRNGALYWYGEGSTFTFTGGTFLNVAEGGTTNVVRTENANRAHSMTLVATGEDTVFVGSVENRVRNTDYPSLSFNVLDGAKAFGEHYMLGGIGSTNEFSGGASVTFDSAFTFGSFTGYTPGRDNLLTIDGATLAARNPASSGTLYVGNGYASQDNLLLAKNGAKIDLYALAIGINAATNNEMRLAGVGTKFTQVATASATSYIGSGDGSVSNRLVVSDQAVAEFNRTLLVGTGSSLGATLRIENGGVVTNKVAVYIGHNNNAKNGKSARVVVTGEGSEWSSPSPWTYLINGTGDAEYAHEIFVGDGAKFTGKLGMAGVGNRLVVSNATVSLSNLFTTNTYESVTGPSGSTIRIAGENAQLTTSNLNGNDKAFAGSEILEFVIPENGWASAPFVANVVFTIRTGVTLKLDVDSVKAYVKANPNGGTVPLMYTGSANRAITIEDATALAANLPDGCSLVNASGVLSVKMPKAGGLTIIVR